MTILLKNATFIDWQTLHLNKTHIIVEQGQEGGLKFLKTLPKNPENYSIIDCSGKFVTKSFACGHHHVYSALARGMGTPKKTPENFYEILQYIWWKLDKALDKDMIEASALVTAIACAKNGVTFIIDHHSSPDCIDNSLEIIANGFEKVGISHLLCYEITDRNGAGKAEKGLYETNSYLQNYQGLVGLHASFTVGNNTLQKAAELAQKYNSGIHIHVAEDLYDQIHCQKKFNMRVIERLKNNGVLDFPKTILAHCLHLNKREKEIIKSSQAWVVQNSDSNMNNNVGFFNSSGLGDRIMLGTDGMHSDLLRSAKMAFLIGQRFDAIDFEKAYHRFRNIHNYIQKNNFSGDNDNNLVVLDYDTPTEINRNNFLSHFIYGIENRHIIHVISSGRLIVKNRNILTVDEEQILNYSRKAAKKLWEKMKK
ncbi:MAG: amidohydrolase family protein [Bacteroidia bacterium]|nr:amidohydrolase family protein [Bacteroidia bacterium]